MSDNYGIVIVGFSIRLARLRHRLEKMNTISPPNK